MKANLSRHLNQQALIAVTNNGKTIGIYLPIRDESDRFYRCQIHQPINPDSFMDTLKSVFVKANLDAFALDITDFLSVETSMLILSLDFGVVTSNLGY